MFKERKAAQMAAFFLAREEGCTMYILKLMKLLYLAERESLSRYGTPMCGDHAVSMDHGPVLSTTLNFMNGCVRASNEDGWESWVSDREEHKVALKREATPDALDALSAADKEILQYIWDEFGSLDRWELVAYTHNHCPEWKNPNSSSIPISYERIFLAIGHCKSEAGELAARIEDEQAIARLLQAD